MTCPKCRSTECKKNGTNSAGTQRYCCKICGCTFVPNAQHGGQNRINDGLTAQQRYDRANRAKISERQRQRRKEKKIRLVLDNYLSPDLLSKIDVLASQQDWKKNYIIEQSLRAAFGLPTDYTVDELNLIVRGAPIE